MKEPLLHPTPYPDINAVLHVFVSNVQAVLGDLFVGLYLYGSLACGDFDPLRSDVDFLVVTATEIPQTMLPALEAMHERIAAIGLKWARKLEGSYIPQAALRRYNPAHARHPSYWSGRFGIDLHRSDWILHLRHDLVARPRLIQQLDAGLERRFTLVSARGGWRSPDAGCIALDSGFHR